MKWIKRISLLLAAAMAFSFLAVPAPANAKSSSTACAKAIKMRPIYAPLGLTISCVKKNDKNLHGHAGYSSWNTRTTRVWISKTSPKLVQLVAHEFSHAWAWQVMTPALRAEFAAKLGKRGWFDGVYSAMPSEVWAYNQGRCHGYTLNPRFKKVSCSLIANFEQRAKAAGR